MILRIITNKLISYLDKPEAVILTGPRRSGKTTLIKHLAQTFEKKRLKSAYFDFDNPPAQNYFKNFSIERIKKIISESGNPKIIFFDEIQNFPRAGTLIKLFVDYFPKTKVYATGSSSFYIHQNLNESLAGRKFLFYLFPFTLGEIKNIYPQKFFNFEEIITKQDELTQELESMAVWGSYPEVAIAETAEDKKNKLADLTQSALFKDLLGLEGIRYPAVIKDLTTALGYQIGNLISLNELAQNLGVSRNTVRSYLDLLEKFFIIFPLYPYTKNRRFEVNNKFKVYFWDLGIRNAILDDFRPLSQRLEKGALLENLVIAGVQKRIIYENKNIRTFFWRNYEQSEVDLVLEEENKLTAIEIKYQNGKISKSFFNQYSPKKKFLVNFENTYRFCL